MAYAPTVCVFVFGLKFKDEKIKKTKVKAKVKRQRSVAFRMPHYDLHPTERVRCITNDTLYWDIQERMATIPGTVVGHFMRRMLMSQNVGNNYTKDTTIGKCPN